MGSMLACASAPIQTVSRWLASNGLLEEASLTSTDILRFRLADRRLPDRPRALVRNASIKLGSST
jgi:hypothetical protein